MIRSFLFISLAAAVPLTASADFLKLQKVDGLTDLSSPVFSRNGAFAYSVSYPTPQTFVVGSDLKAKSVTDREYSAQGVNDSGNVVGVKFNTGSESETDFAFYTPAGGSSQLLLTSDTIFGASINNANSIVVLEEKKANFFNGTTAIGSVTLGANQNFTSLGFNVLKDSGLFVTQLEDLGTLKYATVSLTGGVTILSSAVLPGSAGIVREESDGSLLINYLGKVAHSDLKNAPVVIAGKSVVNKDNSGTTVYSEDAINPNGSLYPIYRAGIRDGSKASPLSCLLPKTSKQKFSYLYYTTPTGKMIAQTEGANYKQSVAVLSKTGGELENFCASVTARIVGKCKSKFRISKDSLFLDGTKIKSGTQCEAEIIVKDAKGKPLANKTVASTSSGETIRRGTTDRSGKVRFKFKVNSYTYMVVHAPYADKKTYGQDWTISASGD